MENNDVVNIIGALNNEIFDIRNDSNVMLQQYQNLKSNFDVLQTRFEKVIAEKQKLQSIIDNKEDAIKDLHNELINKDKEYVNLEQNNNSTTSNLKMEIQSLFNELKQSKENKNETEIIKKEREQMLNDIGELENHIYELSRNIDSFTQENRDLLNEISEIRENNERQKNQFLLELENERTKSIEVDDLKWKIESLSKEKEILKKRLADDHEVNEAIKILKSENEIIKAKNNELEKKIQESMIREIKLKNEIKVSENAEIHRLEGEKLELLSRISVLESKLQLKEIQQRDAEMLKLENLIKDKQNEIEKYQNNQRILLDEKENTKNELEETKEKMNQLEIKCTELEYKLEEAENNEKENKLILKIEKLKNKKNIINTKCDELKSELINLTQEKEELQSSLNFQIEQQKELRNLLSSTQLQSTKSDTTNIMNRSENIRLNKRISELESINRTLQNSKNALMNTISENNQRHQKEIEKLSKKVYEIGKNNQEIELISTLNLKILELTNKLNECTLKYQNESADHYSTKQNLVRAETNYNDLSLKFRNIETDYTCLVESLTKLFNCMPSVSSIVSSATQIARTNSTKMLLEQKVANLENQLKKEKEIPNVLEYRLKQLEFCLNLEKKKSSVFQMKLSNAQTLPILENDEDLNSRKPSSFLTKHNSPFGVQPIPSRSYF